MPSSVILKSDGFRPLTYLPLLSVTVKVSTTRSTFEWKTGTVGSCASSQAVAPITVRLATISAAGGGHTAPHFPVEVRTHGWFLAVSFS